MSHRARRRRLVRRSFRVFCCAVCLVGTAPRGLSYAGPNDPKAKIDVGLNLSKMNESTVKIHAEKHVGRSVTKSEGAGVIIDSTGYILTAKHVIEDLDSIEVTTADQDTLKARLVFIDHDYDIALIKVTPTAPLTVAQFAHPSSLSSGKEVVVIGNPLGMGQTIVKGILGQVKQVNWGVARASLHSISARIQEGNSGGGTFDLATGMFLGINVAKSSARPDEGYMVPVDRLTAILNKRKTAVGELTDSHEIENSLGVRLRPVSLMDNDKFSKGLLVTSVEPGSAADKSGWEVGDVLVCLDNYKTADLDSVLYVLNDAKRDTSEIRFMMARGDTVEPGKVTVPMSAALAASSQTQNAVASVGK